jgi:tripartite-type tricarboxylate transporter receptor subunit TctC
MPAQRALLFIGLAMPLFAAAQQDYPNKSIRLIVPYPAGGANDIFARPIAKKLSDQLGQQVVVDNRSGASGVIGAQLVAGAAPDGYTLLATSGSLTLIPLTMKNAPFDVLKDFTCIVAAATSTTVVVIHPSLPVQSMKELAEYGRKNPGQLKYGTAGAGRMQHLTGETLAHALNTKLIQISYKGGHQAMIDLLGGHVSMGVLHLSTVLPHVKAGRLRALAVAEDHRSKAYPEIPTAAESGFAKFAMPEPFLGFTGPARLPSVIVKKLNAEVNKALLTNEVRAALEGAGYTVTPGTTPEYCTDLQARTFRTYQRMVKEVGLTYD